MARRLVEASAETIRDCYSNRWNASQLLEQAENRVYAIADQEMTGDTTDSERASEQAVEAVWRRAGGEVTGVSSGFADLDHLLTGFEPGTLTIVAARPSMGKTAFALNLCLHAAIEQGIKPLVVSLEMGAAELAARLLQARAPLDGYLLRNAWRMTDQDRAALTRAANEIRLHSFPIDETPIRTASQIAANARRQKARQGIGLVVIDYLQMIGGDNPKASRQEQVAEISRRLKAMAKELALPVIALSQLNRASETREDRRPRMADLRESARSSRTPTPCSCSIGPTITTPTTCPAWPR